MVTASSTHPLSFSSSPIISQTSNPPTSKLANTTTTLATAPFSKNRHFKMEELPSKGIYRRRFVEAGIPFLWAFWNFPEPSKAKEVEVGSYLPQSQNNPSFVVFKASSKDTPALRAGNVQPYEFIIPPTWKQTRIANILSGNYCQPKCAEPWIEVKFENQKQGKIQVVASPLIRLTNKLNATIEDIGSPEKVIAALGPFVTGNGYDPDELITSSIEKRNGQTYYNYVLETPYASTGTHNLAKATAKGSTVVLFVASADDRQWPASQNILKEIVESFNV